MKQKSIYRKPELEEYGSLKSITNGLAGGATESGPMTDSG
jgi:hypothetical protein